MAAPRFDRYERVYHKVTREYGNLVAPGSARDTVLFARGAIVEPVYRSKLRRLYWWERLLNR